MKLIIVLFLNIYSFVLIASPLDSIGIEKTGKRQFILYKVGAKETVYSIARKYGKSVKEIKDANSGLQSSINIGQVVKIPYTKSASSASPKSTGSKKHKVTSKETLYSVAKKYHISVDQLKKSNPGVGSLKVGSILSIPENTKSVVQIDPKKELPEKEIPKKEDQAKENINKSKIVENKQLEDKEDTKTEPIIEEEEPVTESKKAKKEPEQAPKGLAINNPAPTAPANASYKKTIESGFADVTENSNETLKYLAWHKTAPLGTIVQIENQDNHQKIFVRVIGKLASTEKVLIKISAKAMERLDGKSRIPVVLTYIP